MRPMYNHIRTLKNFLGLFLKIAALPVAIAILGEHLPLAEVEGIPLVFSMAFIIVGIIGLLVADILLMRFGDGNVHLSNSGTRLVDVGFYARTRHPFFWFLSLYQLGILISHLGISLLSISIWLILTVFGIGYLSILQERQLFRSFGDKYRDYQETTPLYHWKIKIAQNRSVKLLPQLIWIFGMLFLRNWYKIQVSGIEHIPHEKPFILVANHESYLDPFLFAIFLPFELKFVTTADVFTSPLMRFLLGGIGTFPMRRHRQDLKSIRTMIRMIKSGQVVGIFPEGGRSIDGTPLPILNETLKLIQHSKVPILPVHLDGAYEIWPRWAEKRRRGQVSASFKPVIPVEDQADLEHLKSNLETAIFSPEKEYRAVKSRSIANGLETFLWACPECDARNSIAFASSSSIRCGQCESLWTVTNNYTLINNRTSKSLSLHEWIQDISDRALDKPISLTQDLGLAPGERAYQTTTIDGYKSEDGVDLTDYLSLTITDKRFLLFQKDQEVKSWPLDSITIFTLDYYNAVSIGVGGIRHTFFLPANEIGLKWQTYFEKLTIT